MLLARTKAEGLALLSQFFLTGTSACLLEFHGHADLLHISLPYSTFSQGGTSPITENTWPVLWGAFMSGPTSKAWGVGVRL